MKTFVALIIVIFAPLLWADFETTTNEGVHEGATDDTIVASNKQQVPGLQFKLDDQSPDLCPQPPSDRVWLVFFDEINQSYSIEPREKVSVQSTNRETGEACQTATEYSLQMGFSWSEKVKRLDQTHDVVAALQHISQSGHPLIVSYFAEDHLSMEFKSEGLRVAMGLRGHSYRFGAYEDRENSPTNYLSPMSKRAYPQAVMMTKGQKYWSPSEWKAYQREHSLPKLGKPKMESEITISPEDQLDI